MAFDISFYEKKYAEEKACCIKDAKRLINIYNENKCSDETCYDCELTSARTTPTTNKFTVKKYNDMTCAILYSCGYWGTYVMKKRNNMYRVTFHIKLMTPEEKIKAHTIDRDEEEVRAPVIDEKESDEIKALEMD